MNEYDSPWKEALDYYFQPFTELCFPVLSASIDWSSPLQTLDKELQQIAPQSETASRVVDKLFSVQLLSGGTEWILIHLEVQSQHAPRFAERVFVYFYRLRDKYDRQVVSLVVLGDNHPNWRPNRFIEENFGCRLEFQFPMVKLLDFADNVGELESSGNLFAPVILAHLMTMQTAGNPDDRCRWKLRLLRPLYARGCQPKDVRQLFRVIDWMMALPQDLEIEFRSELEKIEQESHMPYITSVERLAKEEGRQEGRQEGRLEGELAILIRMKQETLGERPPSSDELYGLPLDTLRKMLQELDDRIEQRKST
jgi:predicted transposase/invertase (TIGR01784 family)